ncbi:hypothetical protein GALMADRAFT_1025820 [Galerina marginata CBS 339.88]|uniref:Protein kinase domain-containing protein n=1 Tax=Galerina marginata (strain CBS 339.88) TaxID=685588 RepID=A0A067SFD7_GALM3|nr:hypothetical protein GALMADRAFT_1025820 [Galerina marginata CBS 339.88]
MAIWSFSDQGDENSGCSGSNSPFTPPSIYPFDTDNPLSPRLEVRDIDAVPFSQNFVELFDGLGLHIAPSREPKHRVASTIYGSPDVSYDIENYTNIKDIDPEWKHDDIEEIIVMSHKRLGGLATIQEDVTESNVVMTPAALLSEFDIEDMDNLSRADHYLPSGTKTCIRRDNGQKYLIKRRRTWKNTQWSELAILEKLAGLSLPFTAYMRWTFHSGDHVYIVTDYHAGGSLMELVNQHGSLGSHRAVFYASELVSAISSLQAAGIVHRDLQPQNILLDTEGHIVVTNFEHAEFSSTIRSQGASACSGLMDSGTFKMNEYRAPEVYMGWSHDESVDCWSFGMVLYFMFFGTDPYGGREGGEDDRWFHDRIVGFGIPTESLRLVHPMARDLILKCLERNSSMRWSMDKIKTHGYFALVNWDQVSDRGLDVPSFRRSAMEVDRNNFRTEAQRRHASLTPSVFENDRQLGSNSASSLRRTHLVKGTTRSSRPTQNPPVLPELFQPVPTVSIPSVVQEEDEPTSISASTGHPCMEDQLDHPQQPEEPDPAERISRFWADIDREGKGSAVSVTSLEFGGSTGVPYTEAPKLRKHRSVIHSSHRLFNISTSSFQNRLRKKPRSTGALRTQTKQAAVQPMDGLPMGVHQIGSGIGFTYNVPAGVPSKVSVCSFAPPTCLFHGGFSTLNLNLGLGLGRANSGRRAKAKVQKAKMKCDRGACASDSLAPSSSEIGDDHVMQDEGALSRSKEEVGKGTFIREMYRAPSWILSPPDNLPSPLALVNANASDSDYLSPLLPTGSGPGTDASFSMAMTGDPELLTPATLVDSPDCADDIVHEVNISIPKGLKLDLNFSELCEWAGAPSTLRLVPQTPKSIIDEEMMSYAGMSDASDSFVKETWMHLEHAGGC